jgi:sugar phosphate isomerase/epimerase
LPRDGFRPKLRKLPRNNQTLMLKPTDLILSHYCLAAGPAERFEAAARAGFAGVAISWDELKAARAEEGNLKRFGRLLKDNGLAAPQLEYLTLPAAGGVQAFLAEARDAAETSAEMGCEVILVLGTLDPAAPVQQVCDAFAQLTQTCGEVGMKCAIEFVPGVTAVPDLASARRLVRAAASPSAGLLVDSLHFYRSDESWQELKALRPGEVLVIQINDGPLGRADEDYVEECLGRRLLPGDGSFDLPRFVERLSVVAPAVPLSAEVINLELQQRYSAAELAQRIAERTRGLLAHRLEET